MADCINDLYDFYMETVASRYADKVEAPHIRVLSRELMKLYLGDFHRLCVSTPPRHSKSSMVTLAYPLWLILNNPDLNILVVNAEASLSENFGIRIRELVKEIGPYFNVHLSDVKHSSTHIKFEDNKGKLYSGSIRLVGATGSITGQDADYLIIDDPYKGIEDITPTQLSKKLNWFDSIIEQRIEIHTRLVILHTRWHSNDLISFLERERNEDYKFVTFPAILPDGTPLWKERYTIEVLRKKQETIGERLFQSIYQQKPIDDTSDFFNLNKIHWCRPEMEIVQKVRGWDIASSKTGSSDYTAGVPMFLLDDMKSVLITDFVYGQFGNENTANVIKEQVRQDGVDNVSIIETGVAAAGAILFDEWEKQLEGYFVERGMAVSDNSKSDRATPLQHKILDGEVFVDIVDDKLRQIFIDEFRAFPDGAHDDIVDAASHAFNYLNEELIGFEPFEIIDIS
ncbi:MAG: hypothetical protein Q4P18_07175 [Methanobrevibacter sp.]|uniref:hypothetical protein n=1 Tax=Methanobrevibacter sp. TaxID=66852 RepID=UPI0026DED6C2|nr:hypothetical protein [Methanobrevibacter sp.]MDO5849299.1 hypothetical protein [Methanobrevibacter sp.]